MTRGPGHGPDGLDARAELRPKPRPTCDEPGCGAVANYSDALGDLCGEHFRARRREQEGGARAAESGDPNNATEAPMVTTTTATTPTATGLVADPNAPEGRCRVLGCGRDANKRCRGLCKTHYNRAYTLGREALDRVALPPMSQAERCARRAATTATTTATGPVAEASASVALDGDTHSPTCWQEHPRCAQARLEEVLAAVGGNDDVMPVERVAARIAAADVARLTAERMAVARPMNNRALDMALDELRELTDSDGYAPSAIIARSAQEIRELRAKVAVAAWADATALSARDAEIGALKREIRDLRASLCQAVGHPSAEDLAGVESDGPLTDQEIAAEVRLVVRELRGLRHGIAAKAVGAPVPEGELPSDAELVRWVEVVGAAAVETADRRDLVDRQRAEVVELLGLPPEADWETAMLALSQLAGDGYAHRCALHAALGGREDEDPGEWVDLVTDVSKLSDDLDEAGKPQDPEYYVELAASAYEARARNLRAVASTRCVR